MGLDGSKGCPRVAAVARHLCRRPGLSGILRFLKPLHMIKKKLKKKKISQSLGKSHLYHGQYGHHASDRSRAATNSKRPPRANSQRGTVNRRMHDCLSIG